MFSLQIVMYTALLLIKSSQQEAINNYTQTVLLHNVQSKYYLDKGEIIQVWAKNIQDPWQDNRLFGGVSDLSVLSFNLTSHQQTTKFKGVITRNLAASIFQNRDHVATLLSSRANFSGEIEFHVKTFSGERSSTVSTKIAVGCPPNRHLKIKGAQLSKEDSDKIVHYDFNTFGCPIQSNTTSTYKPEVLLYDGDDLIREVTSNYIVWEIHGRNSYRYSHTMQEVGCLRPSQSWADMTSDANATLDQAWTQHNFESCFVKSNGTVSKKELQRSYEILNSTGGSSLKWDGSGIYALTLRVIDTTTSYCDLTAQFAFIVTDTSPSNQVIPTFVVLSSSCFGILLGSIAAFYMDTYCTSG